MSKRRPSSSRKKSQKALAKDLPSLHPGGLLDEALAVSFCALALFLCVSFLSFEIGQGAERGPSGNVLGPVGHVTGTLLAGLLGWCSLVPVGWALAAAVYWWRFDERRLAGGDDEPLGLRGVLLGLGGLGCVVVGAAALAAVFFGMSGGGRIGQLVAAPLVRLVNPAGATLILGAFLLFALSIATRRSVFDVILGIAGGAKVGGKIFGLTLPTLALRGVARVAESVGNGVRGLSARVADARDDDEDEGDAGERGTRGRGRSGSGGEGERSRGSSEGTSLTEARRARAKERAPAPLKGEPPEAVEPSPAAPEPAGAPAEQRDYSHVVVKRRDNADKKLEVKKVRRVDPPEVAEPERRQAIPYELPDAALLTRGEPSVGSENDEELRQKSRQIESKLRDFGINGQVTQVHPGPVITLFEFEPAPGVKVGKIAALQDDLAMSLRASSIRIIAPIPKRGTVGIEVPNKHRDIVRLRDCLESEAFGSAESTLSVAIGKDTYGDPVVVDIAAMPHLLMAGATGTGKSVCINTLLLSLLYRATPEELGLILIDPKILELSIYEDIPHLRVPVVTVPRQAKAVLDWAVNEMNRRYRLMQRFGVRNIDGYNRVVRGEEAPSGAAGAVAEANIIELKEDEVIESGTVDKTVDAALGEEGDEGTKGEFAEKLEPLPKIVIVIDELADLMLTVGRDIEELITRLAQKARASGIHLILATQRPSVDVITGLIKANFPARLSFRVSSRIDSRTILDSMGAEKLLGRGDMLFMAPGAEALKRVHGAFVSDAEVKRVVDALKALHKPRYDERIMALCDKALQEESEAGQTKDLLLDEDEYDAIYDRAVELVMEKGQASTSMLQRAFRIGYNRAARIIDLMEREGVVGPMDGAKPREVIVPRDEQADP